MVRKQNKTLNNENKNGWKCLETSAPKQKKGWWARITTRTNNKLAESFNFDIAIILGCLGNVKKTQSGDVIESSTSSCSPSSRSCLDMVIIRNKKLDEHFRVIHTHTHQKCYSFLYLKHIDRQHFALWHIYHRPRTVLTDLIQHYNITSIKHHPRTIPVNPRVHLPHVRSISYYTMCRNWPSPSTCNLDYHNNSFFSYSFFYF